MNTFERPATRAFKERWTNLVAFWRERRNGPWDRDFTEWRIEMGLTPRTAKESYWDAGPTLGIIRIVCEKKEKLWEYCSPPEHKEETVTQYIQRKSAEKKPKLSAKAREFFENCRIKEIMKAGPCAPSLFEDTDCTTASCKNCQVYCSLKNKDFLEHEEAEGKNQGEREVETNG